MICQACLNENGNTIQSEVYLHDGIDYKIAVCSFCKTAFSHPMPSNQCLKDLYSKKFDYRWYRDHYKAKYNDVCGRIFELREYLGNSILDYGGGLGYLSSAALEHGYKAATYDPYTTESLPNEKWDSVVSLHTLEHSNNLDLMITAMKDLLSPNGRLVIAVPNFESIGYKELGMSWVWAQPPTVHIFHFTSQGVKTLLERHGFKVLKIEYKERWDANIFCDLINEVKTKRKDASWSNKIFNRFSIYRNFIASRNSSYRAKGLESSKNLDYLPILFSELVVIAELE
jgi:hypothetical protein